MISVLTGVGTNLAARKALWYRCLQCVMAPYNRRSFKKRNALRHYGVRGIGRVCSPVVAKGMASTPPRSRAGYRALRPSAYRGTGIPLGTS